VLINLSQFLQIAPASKNYSIALKPGSAQLPAYQILQRDKLFSPTMLVPRHCTNAFEPVSERGQICNLKQYYTAITPLCNQISPWRQKLRHASLSAALVNP
jgi:hypothetical protein